MPNSLRCKIKHLCHNGTLTEREQDRILKALEQEPKWIPVSERLPKDSQIVWFSTGSDVYEGRYYDDNTDNSWYIFRLDLFESNRFVTAWMPLLEPYKAESEDRPESEVEE